MRYTYSRWDNTQDIAAFDPDALMEALSDDLLSDGDMWNALQRVMRWGLQQDGQERAPGLQNLLQRLRAQRQQELERYDLDSTLQDIRDALDEVVATERDGIDRRLQEAGGEEGDRELREMLASIAHKKEEFLDQLPPDVGPALSALANYEFLDEQARAKFEALMDRLQQQVLQTHFQHLQQSLQGMGPQDVHDLKDMLRDLNTMLQDRLEGVEPDFRRFMENHGRFFPDAQSLDELLEQMQEQTSYMESLLRSMSPDMRRALQQTLESVLRDEDLVDQLGRLSDTLQALGAFRRTRQKYPFSGEESLTIEEALRLMQRMSELEQLERDMKRAQDAGNLEHVDSERVQRLMGNDAYQAVEQLKQLTRVLEEAGYIEQRGDAFELTARGVRKIGQKALHDIFRHLKRDAFGRHSITVQGAGGDRADDTKEYEYGDPFLLDLTKTLMNSLLREGSSATDSRGQTLRLAVDDFEVFRTEYLTRSSTVLMLDMSRSMPLRGCFVAAKKVAFALHSLIRTQFPRDHLYIIGFSDYARELRPETLHQLTWGDYVYGTNMQHGFMLARRLLGRHKAGNKQVILITDGEPTAHFEGDRVHFSYPPTFRTFQETLREVKRCTQEGIVINTFMLERSHYLADFVNQMTRINRGRAFFATPERLGDYVLVDYVQHKHGGASPGRY